jgi:hypothetical protein
MVRVPIRVPPPTLPLNVIFPVPDVRVRSLLPLTVPKAILPRLLPPELNTVAPDKVIGLAMEILLLEVRIDPLNNEAPPPL